jgi:hypothetical protein
MIGHIIGGAFKYKSSTFLIVLFVMILVHFILLKKKKENLLLHKMLVIDQIVLLIAILIEAFFLPVFMFFIMILLAISLLQVINLFITSPKGYKVGSIIAICVSLLCFVTFWYISATVCRFEFELNDDGKSYAIVEIKSDINTITIPTTYQGLPVTRIKRTGLPIKWNIEEIFIPIEVIYIDEHAISYCPNAIIYCEAESRPDTWDKEWFSDGKKIIWGSKE